MPNSSTKQQRGPLHSISLIAIAISVLFVLGACDSATSPFNFVVQDNGGRAESPVESPADTEQEDTASESDEGENHAQTENAGEDVATGENDSEDSDSEDSDSEDAIVEESSSDKDSEDENHAQTENADENADDENLASEDAIAEESDTDENFSMLACQDEDHGDEVITQEEVLEIVEVKAANTALGGALADLLSQIVIREETADEDATTETDSDVTEEAIIDDETNVEASIEDSEQIVDSDTEEAGNADTATDEIVVEATVEATVEAQPNLGETLAGLFSQIVIQPETANSEVAEEVTEDVTAEITAEITAEAAEEDSIGMMVAGTGGANHPLDGLTADEYQRLVNTLTNEGKAGGETHFLYVGLHEPDKDFMLSWNSWDEFPRLAAAIVANGDDLSLAVVDVVSETVVSWESTEGMPIPADSMITGGDHSEVVRTVAEGAGYIFDGDAISWHNWSFHHRFDQQGGLVLSEVNYLNKGRLRSVLYQMQLEAIIAPYVGEDTVSPFGIPLESGIDCPDTATYVGALFADSAGQPYAADSMVCIFEAGDYMGTAATELVVRTAAATENHQYLVDYIFDKGGTIQGQVTLTGFDDAQLAQEGAEESASDTLIAPYLTAVSQDHYFHFRLDLDIDGVQNNFVTAEMTDSGDGGWVVISTVAETEEASLSSMNSEMPTSYQVVNPNAYSGLGHSPAYMIIETNSNVSLADSFLWAAPQSEGESIANTDIVVWYQMGFHHIFRMEDWSAKPMYSQGFQLVPFNFFELNPSVGE